MRCAEPKSSLPRPWSHSPDMVGPVDRGSPQLRASSAEGLASLPGVTLDLATVLGPHQYRRLSCWHERRGRPESLLAALASEGVLVSNFGGGRLRAVRTSASARQIAAAVDAFRRASTGKPIERPSRPISFLSRLNQVRLLDNGRLHPRASPCGRSTDRQIG